MSLFVPKFDESVIVREADAEVVGGDPVGVRLLADSSSTGGALSTVRVTLGEGADGAVPHLHRNSAEMFYLLDGAADVLSGDDVVTAGRGDLVVVPPGKPHAVKALGRDLVLWRDAGGALKCLEDYCPHRGARLSRGEVTGDNISCRYHGVTLDGTGTIVRVPAMPDCALEGRRPVESFPVAEAADGIFVYFAGPTQRETPPREWGLER